MSNNNNTRSAYNKVGCSADDHEMEMLLNSPSSSQHISGNNLMTAINIENDIVPGTSRQHLQRQQSLQEMRREIDPTRINMESNAGNSQTINIAENQNIDDRQRMPNLFSILREARHQLNRSQSLRDPQPSPNRDNSSANAHSRTWRENLFEVLSSPASPRSHTHFLRALFTPSANFRYDSLHTNVFFPDDQFHITLNHQNLNQADTELQPSLRSQHTSLETPSSSTLRLSRQNSRLIDDSLNESYTTEHQTPAIDISLGSNSAANGSIRRQSITANTSPNSGRQPQRQNLNAGSTTAPAIDIDDTDANAMGEIIMKFLTHLIRYLPFIFIIFVKFIHDHLLGILDILLLHGVVYHVNKSIKEQIAKFNQKSFAILMRDFILIVCVVTYRFILSTSTPDPFGLLINPPPAITTVDLTSMQKTNPTKEMSLGINIPPFAQEVPSSAATNYLNSTISITKPIQLGILLYYIAVNDLILKLLTQLIKISITMIPFKLIRHKTRARLYAVIEDTSQFYRALVPIKQWLIYLFESYTGLEVISGILFSSFYMGAKLFELFARGRPLKNAICTLICNMDYDRKPTRDELEAAGAVCPICHDSYSSPVILECGHIFCDECVNTWFKREQTCPMCRAKVSEDPTWQDGATTYFYQLC